MGNLVRWIIFALLFLNLASFLWFWRAGGEVAQEPSSVESSREEVPGLVLLSERGAERGLGQGQGQAESASREVAAPAPPVVPELAAALTPQCAQLEGFTDRAQAEQFLEAYTGDFNLALINEERSGAVAYRVYLPPLASRDEASATLIALRARLTEENLNIDSFLVTSGELQNGISLGLFGERDNALNVERQMTALGYEVTVSEESRARQEPVVLLRELPEGASLLDSWPRISSVYPQLQRTEKLCETIAHEF